MRDLQKRNRLLLPCLCQLVATATCIILSGVANAFLPIPLHNHGLRQNRVLSRPRISSSTFISRNSLLVLHNSLSSSEIFILSFDGTVAQTTEWRISQGIDVALQTWPHLKQQQQQQQFDQNDDILSESQWLRNKMKALSSVLTARPNTSLSCEYALLARLLMEEQWLDQGRSNGKSGKYASQFHPQTSSATTKQERYDDDTNTQGSRPLTVGEISANWNKGGCLADTVLAKYHVNYKNPLPILQENVEQLQQEKEYNVPAINDAVLEALTNCCGNVIVTVGHESDLSMAKNALCNITGDQSSLDVRVVSLNSDDTTKKREALFPETTNKECMGLTLIPIESTYLKILQTILSQAPRDSTIYVFESAWQALEEAITLFGDNIPRGGSGMAPATDRDNVKLSLNFPNWAHGQSRDTQKNEALMNPWTNLVTEQAFSELLSARIVKSS